MINFLFISAFKDFLNEKAGVHKYIAKAILSKLDIITKLFEYQDEFTFYGSSILVVYDAKYIEDLLSKRMFDGRDPDPQEDDGWFRVYMIDFAHVFPSSQVKERDENYIFGLKNFSKLISNFADNQCEYLP